MLLRTLPCAFFVAALVGSSPARATDWVDRPLTNGSMHAQGEAGYGIGFGARESELSAPVMTSSTDKGSGFHLGASLGLPLGFEVGARVGFRIGSAGQKTRGDEFGRVYDANTYGAGSDTVSNPEFSLRSSIIATRIVELGTDARFTIPIASGSSFGLTAGIPLRIRAPGSLRFDTGLYLPVVFTSSTDYGFSIPAQLWVQIGDLYVGALSGVKIYRQPLERVDIAVGVGAGYTFGGIFDVRMQVLTQRVNDEEWLRATGLGLNVGVMTP